MKSFYYCDLISLDTKKTFQFNFVHYNNLLPIICFLFFVMISLLLLREQYIAIYKSIHSPQIVCKIIYFSLMWHCCYRRRNWLGIGFQVERSSSSWRDVLTLSDCDVQVLDYDVVDERGSPDVDGWIENSLVANHVSANVTWYPELERVFRPPEHRFHPRRSQQQHHYWLLILFLPSKKNQLASLVKRNIFRNILKSASN